MRRWVQRLAEANFLHGKYPAGGEPYCQRRPAAIKKSPHREGGFSISATGSEPGLKVTGSHYFEENIAKVPSGSPEYQIVATPEERWGKVQVFWQGLRIGQLRLDAQQERHMLKVLSLLGPAGTVFGPAGVTTEEIAVELSARTSTLQARTGVQLMMPHPGRLERWAKAGPGEKGWILLPEPVTVHRCRD